jgi:hypothetical protein
MKYHERSALFAEELSGHVKVLDKHFLKPVVILEEGWPVIEVYLRITRDRTWHLLKVRDLLVHYNRLLEHGTDIPGEEEKSSAE